MGIRSRKRELLIACVFVCMTAVVLPGRASAQKQPRDSTAIPRVKDLTLPAEQRQRYIGRYTVDLPQGTRTTLRVYEKNGVLMALPANEDQSRRLLYQGDNVFFADGDPHFALAFVVEHGRATRFTVHRADGVIEGVRAP